MNKLVLKKYLNILDYVKYVLFFGADLLLFYLLMNYTKQYFNLSFMLLNGFVFFLLNIKNVWFVTPYKILEYLWYFLVPIQFLFVVSYGNLLDTLFFYTMGVLVNLIKFYFSVANSLHHKNNTYFVGSSEAYMNYYYKNLLAKKNIIHLDPNSIKKKIDPELEHKIVFDKSEDLINLILQDKITNEYTIKLLEEGNLVQSYLTSKIKNFELSMPDLHITRTLIILSNDPRLTEEFINKFGAFGSKFIIITDNYQFRIQSKYKNNVKIYNINLLYLTSDIESILKSIEGNINKLGNLIFMDLYQVNQFNYQFNYMISQMIIKNLCIQKQVVLLRTETFARTDIMHNYLKQVNYLNNSSCTTLFLNIGAIEENIKKSYKINLLNTHLNDSAQVIPRAVVSNYLSYLVVLQETHEKQFHAFKIDNEGSYMRTLDLIKVMQWEHNYDESEFSVEKFHRLELMSQKTQIKRLNIAVYTLKNTFCRDNLPDFDLFKPTVCYNKISKILSS